MQDFITRKKEYLERLKDNPRLVESIMNKKDTNSKDAMLAVFDPKTEEELEFAINITRMLADSISMIFDYGEIEIKDYKEEPVYNLFKRAIIALKNNKDEELKTIKEELSLVASPEKLGELAYNLIKVFVLNYTEAFENLYSDCGFDINDDISAIQFKVYFEQANNLINSMMPNIEFKNKLDFNNKEAMDYVRNYTNRFHELFEQDFEKKGKVK